MYVTLVELADRPGATELSQVATPIRFPVVAPELLDALLRGELVTSWPDEEVQIGLKALDVIMSAGADATATIDGFLSQRGYSLPLTTVPPIIVTWARAITRYNLHKDRLSTAEKDPIVRDRDDALKFLQLTAAGKFNPGLEDPAAPVARGGQPEFTAPPRVFDQNTLKDFG